MYKLRASIAGFIGLLVLTPSVVLAKNYCISGFPNSAFVLVGQAFHLPGKGHCSQWLGFVPESENVPTIGVACASSDGSDVALTLTTGGEAAEFVEIDTIILSLPAVHGTVTGEYFGQLLEGSSEVSFGPTGGLTGAACTTKTIPAALGEPGASLLPHASR